MNTPPDPAEPAAPLYPRPWARLQARAAGLLPGDFAGNVLRAARLAQPSRARRFIRNPLALSTLTAAACLAVAVILHTQSNNQVSAQNLSDWRDIVAQTANFDPL